MRLREVLTRVLGEAGSTPVDTQLRPSEVVERARRRRRRALATGSLAAGATAAVAVVAALVVPGVLLPRGSELPPIASSNRPSSPPAVTGPTGAPESPTRQPTLPLTAPPGSPGPPGSPDSRGGEGPQTEPAPPAGGGQTPQTPAPQGPSILRVPQHSWETAPKSGQATGRPARLVDIRVGLHETYDRVVFEFRGGRPGYEVSYGTLDAPGSGKRVEVAGSRSLEVIFSGVETPPSYDGPTTLTPRLPSVAQVKYLGGWEGVTKAGIGVSSRSPLGFRVLTLNDPARIVIDVTHTARG